MSEKKKTELEMFARYQQAMLVILQELLNGKRDEEDYMQIDDVVADIARSSNMMIKTMLDKQDEFTEDEKNMYSSMVMMFRHLTILDGLTTSSHIAMTGML